jgi:ABC-type proline/glycine betaine transport system permease subunit
MFASQKRRITPIEQHVHSFLELIPLTAVLIVVIFNWSQFVSLWGLGSEAARFDLVLKRDPPPWTYVATFLFAAMLLEVLPFLEEFVRGWRARKQS